MALVGIYSFPKSGNTWIRGIVSALMDENGSAIPDLHRDQLSDAKEYKGFRFFKHHAGRDIKVWKAQTLDTTHVIHIRRNPLDVFVSYMNYISENVTNSADIPFESAEAISGTELFDLYFHSFIVMGHVDPSFVGMTGDYFRHNRYWLSHTGKTMAYLRYEDLMNKPVAALGFLKDWLGVDDEDIQIACDKAAASTTKNGKFYWRQQEKNYFNFLTDEQVALFLKYRGDECRKLGYDPEYLAHRP